MAALTVVAANVSADQNQGSVIRNYVAGAALTVGQAVYVDTSGYAQPAIGNVLTANAKSIGIVVNSSDRYGSTSIPSGGFCSVCEFGPVYGYYGMTPGKQVWVSKTVSGGLDDAAPTGGVFVFIIGMSIAADIIFVSPGMTAPVSV